MAKHALNAKPARNPLPAATCLLPLLLAGCGDLLKQPYPAKDFFGIETSSDATASTSATASAATSATESSSPAGSPSTSPSSESPAVPTPARANAQIPLIRVHPINVSPPYDGLAFVRQVGPSRYRTDYYNNWVASPSILLTSDLDDALDRGGVVRTILPGSTAHAQLTLDADATQFLIDVTTASRPRAVLAVRFFVVREYSDGQTIVLDRSFRETSDAASDAPADDAAAIGRAYGQVLQDFSSALGAALAPSASVR